MKIVGIILLFILIPAIVAAQTITGVHMPSSVAGGGGTGTTGFPYSVFVQISGWTANASSQAYIKIYSGSTNEYMYSATGVWSNVTTYSNTNQPVVNIDASGNWSGWVYLKHNDGLAAGPKLRAAKVGATSTNLTGATLATVYLNMTAAGNGGWIVRNSSPAVNKGIVAFAGGTAVGSYRTEDNGITEGYSYGAGGFKIAVPSGFVDSLVAYNDDGSRNQTFIGPWSIVAGQETDASIGGGQFGIGTAFLAPSSVPGGVQGSVTLGIAGGGTDTIHDAKVVLPPTWTWTSSVSDVAFTGGGSPVAAVSGDTIGVTGLSVAAGDTVRVQIGNITPADSTANFTFTVSTGTAPDSLFLLGTQPTLLVVGSPIPISEVKQNDANGVPLRLNQLVTVRGVVTVANEFGGPSYIQDNTGGFAIFGSTFSTAVQPGDEVIVTGLVQPFNGLCEIVNPVIQSIVSSGNSVDPLIATCAQLFGDGAGGVEQFEGALVRVNSVVVTDTFGTAIPTWAVSGSGTNYRLTDASGHVDIRVDNGVNFANTPAPQSYFDIIGVMSQFKGSSPFIGGYQLMPRSTADILSFGPIIATTPLESNLQSTSLTITWTTINAGTTRLLVGQTGAYEMGVFGGSDSLSTNHVLDLTGLGVATIYNVKAFSVSGSDTSFAANLVVSTTSAPPTTGQMNVYFNFSVDNTLSSGEAALGNQDLTSKFVSRVNAARHSIDAVFYNLSGSVGATMASALVAAKNRGLRVRVICEQDNRSNAPFNTLASNGVPVITDLYDAANGGAGLMHNKFAVIDYLGGAPDSVWVWSGSWNPTDPGTNGDHQNSIEIQDVALAGAYTAEVNQMWGSTTATPNASLTRFGARKLNMTPHHFVIGGHDVEQYFSPSDKTSSHIAAALAKAQGSVSISMLTFTRKELADTLLALKNRGRKVRIVLDNNTDTGNQFAYLQTGGADIHLKGFTGGLLHHKYAVIDGAQTGGTQWLITGSHNWSSSAENSNDENTLIIQDNRIANLYLQEFGARYTEAGGADPILLDVREIPGMIPSTFALSDNFPNPFNPTTTFDVQVAKTSPLSVKVYDILGKEVATLINEVKAPGTYRVTWNAANVASGIYFCRMQAGPFLDVRKLVLMR